LATGCTFGAIRESKTLLLALLEKVLSLLLQSCAKKTAVLYRFGEQLDLALLTLKSELSCI
jgi:hypothetical protein